MQTTEPDRNGYGLRIPLGEIFSSVINHPKRVPPEEIQMRVKEFVSILNRKLQN
jgi:hypothetical protein